MRKLNLRRLRVLSKVVLIIHRMVKTSTQAIDFKGHLFIFIPFCLPFSVGHSQPEAGISPLTLLGRGFVRSVSLQNYEWSKFDIRTTKL